jgi:hypothetical protein
MFKHLLCVLFMLGLMFTLCAGELPHGGSITKYKDTDWETGACGYGTNYYKEDGKTLVCAVTSDLYGDGGDTAQTCGRFVKITNLDKSPPTSVVCEIVSRCLAQNNHFPKLGPQFDLSHDAYNILGVGDKGVGKNIKWEFVPMPASCKPLTVAVAPKQTASKWYIPVIFYNTNAPLPETIDWYPVDKDHKPVPKAWKASRQSPGAVYNLDIAGKQGYSIPNTVKIDIKLNGKTKPLSLSWAKAATNAL